MCKIKKLVHENGTGNPPTAAHVQWWDNSIRDEDHSRWVHDPWHCNSDWMDGRKLIDYPILPASDFQAMVNMTNWSKPKGFDDTKLRNNAWGIKRMKIQKKDVARVQTYLDIWKMVQFNYMCTMLCYVCVGINIMQPIIIYYIISLHTHTYVDKRLHDVI